MKMWVSVGLSSFGCQTHGIIEKVVEDFSS